MEGLGELLKQLGYATPVVYAAAAYGLFAWLEKEASDEAKAALTSTMNLKDYHRTQIASALVEVFDRLYTSPLLGWRAFVRSMIFTLLMTAAYTYEMEVTFGDTLSSDQSQRFYDALQEWIKVHGDIVSLSLVTNILTDYVSLFFIRRLLVLSGARPVLGLASGTAIGVLIVILGNIARGVVFYFSDHHLFQDNLAFSTFAWRDPIFYGLMKGALYTPPALAVFGWLPLFALGIAFMRLLNPLAWLVGKAQWALKDGKDHPLKAIGYVAGAIVFLVTAGWSAMFRT